MLLIFALKTIKNPKLACLYLFSYKLSAFGQSQINAAESVHMSNCLTNVFFFVCLIDIFFCLFVLMRLRG